MYLTLNKWLSIFDSPHITYSVFLSKAMVISNNGKTYPFKDLINKKISKEISKLYYKIIVIDKNKYLSDFYNRNLQIFTNEDIPLCMNNKKYPKYKNPIRNLYYKEILSETLTIQPNIRPYLDVIIDLYKYYTIDYKLVTPSIIQMIVKNNFSSMLSGLYFRASIMNPIIPYSLSLHLKDKSRVLSPTLGWSSYLSGFLYNNNIIEYVGIDVIKKVCNTSEKIANKHNLPNKIYCKPSEELYKDSQFMKKYSNYFDYVFFSPPYYELELYKGKNQSTNKYKTYEEWLNKYWDKTIKLCYKCLKANRVMIYIISGYRINNKLIDLDKDMNTISIANGFKLIKQINMSGTNVGFTKHKKYQETAYVFYKGDDTVKIKKEFNSLLRKIKNG